MKTPTDIGLCRILQAIEILTDTTDCRTLYAFASNLGMPEGLARELVESTYPTDVGRVQAHLARWAARQAGDDTGTAGDDGAGGGEEPGGADALPDG